MLRPFWFRFIRLRGQAAETDFNLTAGMLPACRFATDMKHGGGPGLVASDATFCLGVVKDIWATLEDDGAVCIGDHVQLGEVVKVVVQFINRHPVTMGYSFAATAAVAMKDEWPCADKAEER